MRRLSRNTLLLAIVLAASCKVLTPKTYQLERIHATYTSEWANASIPESPTERELPENYESFKDTLAAIHNYKAAHGSDTQVAAHLTVLEGMIYLQSGKPGMARLIQAQITKSAPSLKSATGVNARDYIFAICFEKLVDGWEATGASSNDAAKYLNAAKGIESQLSSIKTESKPANDVDSGGAYAATCAAIFYVWACEVSPTAEKRKTTAADVKRVLGPWLTSGEKTAAESTSFASDVRNDRARFVAWYRWAIENQSAPVQ